MLATSEHRSKPFFEILRDEGWALKEAAKRKGDWRIDVPVRLSLWDACRRGSTWYSVVYTEKEFQELHNALLHGRRSQLSNKHNAIQLEKVAVRLWPTGSTSDVSMRMLGAVTVMYWADSQVANVGCLGKISVAGCYGVPRHITPDCFAGLFDTARPRLTPLKRLDGSQPPPPPGGNDDSGDGGQGDDVQTTTEPITITLVLTPPSEGSDPQPPPAGANTQIAAAPAPAPANNVQLPAPTGAPNVLGPLGSGGDDDAAAAVVHGRDSNNLLQVGDVSYIVGVEFDGTIPDDTPQVVGALVAPTPCPPNVYKNSAANVKAAKVERLDKRARPFTATAADMKKIRAFVGTSTGMRKKYAIFSRERIEKWATENPLLEDLKSHKWSAERMRQSVDNLLTKSDPSFFLKTAVKLENMPVGKAPRMLIADGDDGQLMALLVIKCFEDLLFEWMEQKSIKHVSRRDAMDRALTNLCHRNSGVIEGDGAAWDTTCAKKIRDLVENPVLRHIMQVLVKFKTAPDSWLEAHDKINCKVQLRTFFANKHEVLVMKFDAIRRSGHRGTSCLNWWINFTCWSCSLFKSPEEFLDPKRRRGEDITGVMRWWNGMFEGDDSLCALEPKMIQGDKLSEEFEEF